MTPRHPGRVALGIVGAGLALAAGCYENPTSPARCPEFCPGGRLVTVESLFATAISRDSSFSGYITVQQSSALAAADLPAAGVDSRPIFETLPITTRLPINAGTDTTTGPIVVDSMRLTMTVLRRAAPAANLRLAFFRLPVGIDSTTTLAALAPAFAAAPLRVVNLDSLLALPARYDSVTGDTVLVDTLNLVRDSLRRVVRVRLGFDSAQASYSEADSGKLALGVRVSADVPISVALGASRTGEGPSIAWYYRVDSAGVLRRPDSLSRPAPIPQLRGLRYDGFVFDAPAVTLDSNLTVGGIPSTRSLLRFALPRAIRDSSQIIRATLLLVPAPPPPLVTPDTVYVEVRRVLADLGAKSPVAPDTFVARSPAFVGAPADTLRIEMTNIFRLWQVDTTAVTTAYLLLKVLDRVDSLQLTGLEGGSFTATRFFSSRTAALRPAVRLTYVPRLRFGAP